jgi:Sec-independent protein translocase protein TatA
VLDLSGGKLVVILAVALIVFGDKLPEAVRKFGRVYGELRRMSQGFSSEIREALDEPMREVRDTMNTVTGGFTADALRLRPEGTTPEPTATDDGGMTPTSDGDLSGVIAEVVTSSEPPFATDDSTAPEPTSAPDSVVLAPTPEPTDDFEPFPAVPSPP